MNVTFPCPGCQYPGKFTVPGERQWQCAVCDQRLEVPEQPEPALPVCLVCGNRELYKKKDFPHTLGMGILMVACAISFVTYGYYEKWLTWAILIGTALFDGLLYLWVGDVIVCYRCHAHHRGIHPGPEHQPFDLSIGERYRQERIRREQIQEERTRRAP